MRILFLSNFYPPHDIGGYEQSCHEVATRLGQRGHTIAILTSNYRKHEQAECEERVFRILNLESNLLHYAPLSFFISRRKREQQDLQHLERTLREFQPHVVFVWGMWNLSKRMVAYLETHSKRPVVYFLSDLWPSALDMHTIYWQTPARHRFLRLPKRLLASLVNLILTKEGKPSLRFEHVICVSNAVRQNLIRAGLPMEHAVVIHGGIEVDDFPLSHAPRFWERQDGTLRLLYAGGLGEHKGVHTAVKALGVLHAHAPNIRTTLTLVGDGHPAYKAFLRDLASECGVSDSVYFRERVPREQMGKTYGEHDVLVFPSVCEEALPRVPMEAMASGLVVVGTATGGSKEILVDGENALTFAPEDADGLAGQIERLMDDPMLWQRLADTGRRTVLERFTLERMVDEMEIYLNETAGD